MRLNEDIPHESGKLLEPLKLNSSPVHAPYAILFTLIEAARVITRTQFREHCPSGYALHSLQVVQLSPHGLPPVRHEIIIGHIDTLKASYGQFGTG